MRVIDTSVLIRYFTKDDPQKAQRVETLVSRIEGNKEQVLVTPMMIFETVFVLASQYEKPRKYISEALTLLLDLRGVRMTDKELYRHALKLYAEHKGVSFADAFQAAVALQGQPGEIYSYDEDFDKIPGVKRITP